MLSVAGDRHFCINMVVAEKSLVTLHPSNYRLGRNGLNVTQQCLYLVEL